MKLRQHLLQYCTGDAFAVIKRCKAAYDMVQELIFVYGARSAAQRLFKEADWNGEDNAQQSGESPVSYIARIQDLADDINQCEDVKRDARLRKDERLIMYKVVDGLHPDYVSFQRDWKALRSNGILSIGIKEMRNQLIPGGGRRYRW